MVVLTKAILQEIKGNPHTLKHLFPTKSYAVYITMFFVSLLGLSIGYVFSVTTFSLASAYQALQLLSIFLLMFSFTKLIKVNFAFSYYRLVGFIYLLWQAVILLRGDYSDMDYMGVKQLIFDLNYGGLNFLIPLVIFFDINMFTIRRIFNVVVLLGLIYLVCAGINASVLFSRDLTNLISLGTAENYFKYFALPIGLLAFNFRLFNKKVQLLILTTILMIVLVGVFRARRGMLFIVVSISLYSAISFYLTSARKIPLILYSMYGLFALLLVGMISKGKDIEEISFFENISERGMEDTRSNVEDCFKRDMSSYDWVFGKGYNGGYKCPGIDDSIFKNGIRKVIETDYLQLIMNGGIVNVILIYLFMVPAIILGLFFSRNNLIKSFSIWVFLWLVYLYPANVYSFSIYHITVWICAAACYTASLRGMTDAFVYKYFRGKFILTN
ncbi:hypothetical protein [Algoriphagus sp.]|uniref:hypothetical protein n=1 Tax=Algoriphagus sp. TaxID=1872435 RepID=UPI003F703CED